MALPKLPKKLPPEREVAHSIELEVGVKILATKNCTVEGMARCEDSFQAIKKAIMEEPMQVLSDHTKPFEVHIDAPNFAIRGVLI